MGGIRIYADNACDLDQDLLIKHGVNLLCMPITIKDKTYRDRLTITPSEFYKLIAEPDVIPTTAQITPAEFQYEFDKVINNSDDDIIYISFAAQLSGTYQSACLARDMVDARRITVIDSKSASVGYGLTVLRAARAVAAGKNKAEVIAEIEDNIKRIQHIFIVGNMDMLRRGGRVSAASAALGTLLNIKIIMNFEDGTIVPLEKSHGIKKARKRMLEIMGERGYDLENQVIGISYSCDYEGAMELKENIEAKFGCKDFLIAEIGAAIGTHVGPGTYAVCFLS
ncbi:MAG: DegV family protein [Syntrophomonadaceae bacterium]|jgi:DegV family protein with EDD domain